MLSVAFYLLWCGMPSCWAPFLTLNKWIDSAGTNRSLICESVSDELIKETFYNIFHLNFIQSWAREREDFIHWASTAPHPRTHPLPQLPPEMITLECLVFVKRERMEWSSGIIRIRHWKKYLEKQWRRKKINENVNKDSCEPQRSLTSIFFSN